MFSSRVAQSLITTDWFKGRGLAFALSINLSFARIATALNDIASPWIENQSSVPVAVFTGFIVCVISFVSGITIILMDRPVSRLKAGVHVDDAVLEKLKAQGKLPEEYHRLLHPNREEVALEEDEICFNEGQGCDDEAQTGSIVHDFDHIVVATTSPIPKRVRYDCKATNIDSNYESTSSSSVPIVKIEPSSPISATNDNSNPASNSPSSQMQAGAVEDESSLTTAFEEEDYEEGDETVHVEQINGLSARFWILCLITISLYGSAVPFFHICTDCKFFIVSETYLWFFF